MNKYEIIKRYFGYSIFRAGQEEIIDSILSKRDTLGIMPTGAGKSLCYQVPALVMEGITIVISPLISLMKDQVSTLNQAGVHAAYLNSSLSYKQYRLALNYAAAGRYKIIYVAPERLLTEEFLEFAMNAPIDMVTVDEAHCVSQWGQDFRPSYLKINEFMDKLDKRPIFSAFTATATEDVRDDIIKILRLKNPYVLSSGFDRKNLYFETKTPKDKYVELEQYITTHRENSGIVYCLTRKTVDEIYDRLSRAGIEVTKYHAGLSESERSINQDNFIYDRKPVMIATNAFGMGIDKSNVNYVIHYNMPKNIESYYQEAGRAGRDGEDAECILYYSGKDVVINQLFIDNDSEKNELDYNTLMLVKERDRERLRQMVNYSTTTDCLREYILSYFGDVNKCQCNNCSNCLEEFVETDITDMARAVIGCIQECNSRYGINVIADVLHGGNTAKIRQYALTGNRYYGYAASLSVVYIKSIINHLVLREYIEVTNDGYAILGISNLGHAFMEEQNSEALIYREKKENKAQKSTVKRVRKEIVSENDRDIFEALRQLRSSIAKIEKVPPYIVFTDKTLISMCEIKPKDREEMLSVSGVGETKYNKYGEMFLNKIAEYEHSF